MDQDLRKGVRAILAGGLYGADEDTVQQVITAAADAQRSQGKSPALDEVQYLEEYVKLCEEAVTHWNEYGTHWSRGDIKLQQLNDKYPHVKSKKVILLTENLEQSAGWESSSYMC